MSYSTPHELRNTPWTMPHSMSYATPLELRNTQRTRQHFMSYPKPNELRSTQWATPHTHIWRNSNFSLSENAEIPMLALGVGHSTNHSSTKLDLIHFIQNVCFLRKRGELGRAKDPGKLIGKQSSMQTSHLADRRRGRDIMTLIAENQRHQPL
jgi:hypothetical protein